MFWIQNKLNIVELNLKLHSPEKFSFFHSDHGGAPSAKTAALFASFDNAVMRELDDLIHSFSPPPSQHQKSCEFR